MKKILIILVLISLSIWIFKSKHLLNLEKVQNLVTESLPAQNKDDSFAFQELTIPYLRNREYKSELGELDTLSENASYTSYLTSYTSDELKINGLLTVPKGEKPEGGFPAIVFVHGYIPPTLYKTTEKYVDYVNYLARNGFVVFKIDLRGHGSSEGDPGGAYYSSDYIVDTLNAYSALENSDFVNPDKIGLWGHSMAGNVTFKTLAVKKDIPAVVIWAGAGYTYTDLLEYRISDNSYRPPTDNTERQRKRRELMENYGQFDPNSWFWKQVTAINYLDGVNTKLELHHATDDNVVSVEYSRNLERVLAGKSIDVNLYEYPSGGHNLTGSSFSQAMARTVEFYKSNL